LLSANWEDIDLQGNCKPRQNFSVVLIFEGHS
jgi:hypothetical protein